MRIALFVLFLVAAALAWAVARRRAEHRPIAWTLSLGVVADAIRPLLIDLVPITDPAGPPHIGAARLARYVDRALYVLWPFALAAAAVTLLARRRIWPIACAYAAAVAVLVLGYPALRGERARWAYLAIEIVAIIPGLASVVAWWARGWRRVRGGGEPRLDLSERTVAVLVAGQLAIIAGPYRLDLFGSWDLARYLYFGCLGVVVLMQLGEVIHGAKH